MVKQAEFDWTSIRPIDGGFRVKTNSAGTHHIDVLRMIVNCRIVTTPVDDPTSYDRFWCYAGSDPASVLATIAAAAAWDGDTATEPEGWVRNGQTSERRKPE